MEISEVDRIFYADGYRIAGHHLAEGVSRARMIGAIEQLYRSVDELLDSFTSRSRMEGRPAACARGCHWCCHQAVFAVTHEWLYIREYIASVMPVGMDAVFLQRAKSKSDRTLDMTPGELLKFKAPCPFLDEGACSVYPARPMACRIYLSSSEESCREEYLDPGDEKKIPQLFDFPLRSGRMMNEGFVACLREKQLNVAELPLEQGFSSMDTLGQNMAVWTDR